MTGPERNMLRNLISELLLARIHAERSDPTNECDWCGKLLPDDAQANRRFCNKRCNEQFNKPGVLA